MRNATIDALDQGGYLRFRHWRVYREQESAGQLATLLLSRETHLVATHFRSPHQPLWELSDAVWQKVVPPR